MRLKTKITVFKVTSVLSEISIILCFVAAGMSLILGIPWVESAFYPANQLREWLVMSIIPSLSLSLIGFVLNILTERSVVREIKKNEIHKLKFRKY